MSERDGVAPETQVMVASTVYGLATLASAIEDGMFAPAARRILLVSNNAANPETSTGPQEVHGFEQLAKRFDAVFSYNAAVAPQHPAEWMPRPMDIPLWGRYLRRLWDLPDDGHLRLVLESVHVRPAAALCAILHDAEIEVYADGLMSYGPTRSALPTQVATRVSRLLFLDLVPGLRPLLLSEWRVPSAVVSAAAFRGVLAEIAADVEMPVLEGPVTVLLGQYLSALGILTPDEEADLHLRMLRGAVSSGHRRLIFKSHPSAAETLAAPMVAEAEALKVELTLWRDPVLAETLYERLPVDLVVGCFSTALLTAVTCYGLPAARVGTGLLLERLRPYENSNRVPVTLVDALLPALDADPSADVDRAGPERAGSDRAGPERAGPERAGPERAGSDRAASQWRPDGGQVAALVAAVGYAMQPKMHPELRPAAIAFLAAHYPAAARYFKRKRLTALDLPGALPSKPPVPTLEPTAALRPGSQGRLRRLAVRLRATGPLAPAQPPPTPRTAVRTGEETPLRRQGPRR